VAHHKVSVNAQFFPEFPDLVLKQLPQRLDQFQLERGGQAADIVMGFDRGTGAFIRDALNHIRVKRALQEPNNRTCVWRILGFLFDPDGFFLEKVDDCLVC